MPSLFRARESAGGFTLIEVVVSLAIVVTILTGSALLLSTVARANIRAGTTTTAVVLAQQKVEEILSDCERMPMPSPDGALSGNVDGWFDFADRRGSAIGGSPAASAGSAYLRRWSIEPLAIDGSQMVVVQVLVADVGHEVLPVRVTAAKARRVF